MRTVDESRTKITFPIAIVVSRFNEEITGKLLGGALERLAERDFSPEQIEVTWVPGAVELPLVAKTLAASGRFQAVVCLGAVIRGETDHYDYVCSQASYGIQRAALDTGVPVLFGVLTTDNEEQAEARLGGAHGHKGKDVVDAAVEMAAVMRTLR